MDTSSLEQQHRDAASLVDQIEARMGGGKAAEAQQVRQLLSTLIGRLGMHLVVEDKTVYPKAKSSSDANLRRIATRLEDEMNGLAQALKAHSARWASPTKMAAEWSSFVHETQGIIAALRARIELEETEFYPRLAAL